MRGLWSGIARAMLLLSVCLASASHAAPLGCKSGNCGLSEGAYPNIVVGRLDHIASDDEMHAVYRWAKQGVWKQLLDDEADYLERNRLFVLPADERGQQVLVHMSHDEFRRVTFQEGDLVRYTPRMAGNDGATPGTKSIYSSLAGCIAILCRAEDQKCQQQYRPGVYRRGDGVQLDARTDKPVKGGIAIDPISLLPKSESATNPNH
jgi:hypothetical protein